MQTSSLSLQSFDALICILWIGIFCFLVSLASSSRLRNFIRMKASKGSSTPMQKTDPKELNRPQTTREAIPICGNLMEKDLPYTDIGDAMNAFFLAQRAYADHESAFEVLRLYRVADELGYEEAATEIGKLYYYGSYPSLKRNNYKALLWFEKASKNNSLEAMCFLGRIYESGCGTEVNQEKALEFFTKAWKGGLLECRNDVIRVQSRLQTDSEVDSLFGELSDDVPF